MPEAIRRIDRPIISRDPHNYDVEYGPAGAMLHIADIIEGADPSRASINNHCTGHGEIRAWPPFRVLFAHSDRPDSTGLRPQLLISFRIRDEHGKSTFEAID